MNVELRLYKTMKKIGILIFIALLTISCNQSEKQKGNNKNPSAAKTEATQDGIFIHITESYNNPHKVLMPMKMAVMMAEDKDVLVYLDINSVELLVKDAKDLEYEGFDTFQSYLNQLIEKKVGVYVCPTCLKIAGFKPKDLMDGVKTAEKDKFFNFTDGKIITLDY